MADEITRSCVDCGVNACGKGTKNYPDFCITAALTEEEVKSLKEAYADPEVKELLKVASAGTARALSTGLCRAEELVSFIKAMGWHRIGIAGCSALLSEQRLMAKLLRSHGFDVYGVACKAGSIREEELDLCPKGEGIVSCNPVLQAKKLNAYGTDLNVVMGLCIGHDMLFQKYAEAPCTTFVVKDHALRHNPIAALYGMNGMSIYNRMLGDNK